MVSHASDLFLRTIVALLVAAGIAIGTYALLSHYNVIDESPTTTTGEMGTTVSTDQAPLTAESQQLRGTVTTVTDTTIELKTDTGETVTFTLPADLDIEQSNTAAAPQPGTRTAPALTPSDRTNIEVGSRLLVDISATESGEQVATSVLILQ